MSLDSTSPAADALYSDPRAALTVACPRCNARPGRGCESTGGGNFQHVATHQARFTRIEGWTADLADRAASAYKSAGWRKSHQDGPELFAEFEAAAPPIVEKAKPTSPKGVRLTEGQAETIEVYAFCGGWGSAGTGHLHGEAAHRQTVNALEAKGIVEFVRNSDDGYERVMRLTGFGWEVYRHHRLIIGRMSDEQIAEQIRRADEGRCLGCGRQPGATVNCRQCEDTRFLGGVA